MKPIKVDHPPKPNCEIKVAADYPWEPRYHKKGVVFAYHEGFLWPQRTPDEYYQFRWIVQVSAVEWQKFDTYERKDLE